jgi:hypothetical protein
MIDLQGKLMKGTWTFNIAERSLTCQLFLLMVDDLGPKRRDLRGLLISSTGNQGEYSRVGMFEDLDFNLNPNGKNFRSLLLSKLRALPGLDDSNAYHTIDESKEEDERYIITLV